MPHPTTPRLIAAARLFFAFAVPSLLLLSLLAQQLFDWQWSGWPVVFAISLASSVGYYTNFIAIKMLFRPLYPTVFGRQGLIPRNQATMADALGRGIAEHFFAAEEIAGYFRRQQLLETASSHLKSSLQNYLAEPANQRWLSDQLSRFLDQHRYEVERWLRRLARRRVWRSLQKQWDLTRLTESITRELEQNIQSGSLDLEPWVDRIANLTAEKIPELAHFINTRLNDRIESRGTLKRNMAKFLTWSADIDEQAVREQLYRLVASHEFRATLYQALAEMASGLNDYFNSDKGSEQARRWYRWLLLRLHLYLKRGGAQQLIQQLRIKLEKPESWQSVNRLALRSIDWGHQQLDDYLKSDRFDRHLHQYLPVLLHHFNVAQVVSDKVKRVDAARFELLVLDTAGKHLGAIEVLGGLLGGFAGIALIDLPLFGWVLTGLISLIALEQGLTRLRASRLRTRRPSAAD